MAQAVGNVVYGILVNGQSVPDIPLDLRLTMTWGMHDLFAIRIEYNRLYPMSTIQAWPDNALVQITWGRRPGPANTWYGYVNHSEKTDASSGTGNLQYTYYCLGTSKPMNSQVSRVWGSVTPTFIAKQLAQKYHLRCVVTSTAQILSNETQANMSDFSYMNYVAQRCGYRFWVSGGTMYFIDPAVLLQGTARQGVPQYFYDKSLTKQDTVRKFQLLAGDNLPGSTVATKLVSGIDQTSGSLFTTAAGSGSTTLQDSTMVAQSLGEAQEILAAWESLSQYWIGAQAELFGNTLLYPGKLVYLSGNALTTDDSGYWIVVEARHILLPSGTSLPSSDKYVTQCILVKNTAGILPNIKNTVTVTPEFTVCASANGQWYSQSQPVITEGIE